MECFYYPSGRFPDEAELVIQRKDIELFEKSLLEPADTDPSTVSRRAETSYLNIIAALLEVITDGIPSADTTNGQVGPAAGLTSEAKLITAIAHHYQDFDGLSKSNLERKFPAAKRSLKASL